MQQPRILNSKGEAITLNEKESRLANVLQRQVNALGYEINITTLTTIMKKITEQKFFEIAPADYLPVRVGEGSWSSNLVTYRESLLGADFAAGIMNLGSQNDRLARADVGIDSLSIPVVNWAKGIGWSIFDLELAAKSGNWDLVTGKERSRKKNWDLGIQKTAFLGVAGNNTVLGLLNQNLSSQIGSQIKVDTTTLTVPIYTLATSPQNLSNFLAQILNVYRVNCQYSAWPTHFIIPESDYLGLATPSSAQFPLKSILQVMQETLQVMTGNSNFKVLPCRYADATVSGFSNQVYTLLNYAEESLRMDIPVDYTNTLANSIDNFNFQNVGYGQFTGALAYRPLELYYFQFPRAAAGE